ncbi:hypothetical protein, partial [Streptomyces scabichelini]|uniref:hypothetical protein n=1 Tax=Streptomyces scabichelini TaxID=2711217 RepID=UPI0019D1CE23
MAEHYAEYREGAQGVQGTVAVGWGRGVDLVGGEAEAMEAFAEERVAEAFPEVGAAEVFAE